MITRDSWVLTILIVGGALGYLATLPPPTEWTWAQWCNALATVLMTVASKFATSPLRGDPKAPADEPMFVIKP
jgi:hypothetical protein